MASIQKVKVGPYTYYRIVEPRRVNGKPRPIPILHLGTAEQLLDRLLAQTQPRHMLQQFRRGNFEMGAQASAVAVTLGASADADYDKGVAVFTNVGGGLMYEAAIAGQKFKYEPVDD